MTILGTSSTINVLSSYIVQSIDYPCFQISSCFSIPLSSHYQFVTEVVAYCKYYVHLPTPVIAMYTEQILVTMIPVLVNGQMRLHLQRWRTAQVSYLNLEEPPLILVMADCVFYVEWTSLTLPLSLPGSLRTIVE